MYTQCPDCHIAFRVTAKILQQAGGRVKCGDCGHTFNAVDYISEEPPGTTASAETSGNANSLENHTADRSGDNDNAVEASSSFEERSNELLKALDDLAGPDEFRIEDTGVEWRVLSQEEESDPVDDGEDKMTSTGTMDWYIEDTGNRASGTSEALHDGARRIDKPASPAAQSSVESAEAVSDEQRYDDSTPLPDDYEEDAGELSSLSAPPGHDPAEEPEQLPVLEAALADMAFDDPDEWRDLLDEVHDDQFVQNDTEDTEDTEGDSARAGLLNDTGNAALRMEAEEELAAIHSELSANLDTAAGARGKNGGGDELPKTDVVKLEDEMEESGFEFDDHADAAADLEEFSATGLLEDDIADANETPDVEEHLEPLEGERTAEEADETPQESGIDGTELNDMDNDRAAASSHADPGNIEHDIKAEFHEEMRRVMDDREFAATMTSEDGSPVIESIVMEGDLVHGSRQDGPFDLNHDPSGYIDERSSFTDTYMMNRSKDDGEHTKSASSSGMGMAAGVMVLVLLLAGQYVHTSREYLATYGLFNKTIGPVYRALGKPVTPAWNISGWQFETTSGSTSEGDQLLTIYTRVSNRSTQALPYPLVHVSLTDRWEEIVGSRVLEPKEYLTGNPDPYRPVAAGDKFTAVISIATPPAEVAGFKLNVCYRIDAKQLSCAVEDFRN